MKIKCNKKAAEVVVVKAAKAAGRKCCCKAASAKKEVTFTFHGDRGLSVYVAGEFNDWDPTAKKLAYKARSGVYVATLKLAPGSYQYKFVVDGTWCADPENANSVANDQGTFNSVVEVK